jgi:two-component system LytT family response regulator
LFLVTFDNHSLVVLLRTTSYYRDVAITFGATLFLLHYVSYATRRLDERLDWAAAPAARLAAQGLAGIGGASLLALAICYGQYRWIDPEHVFGLDSFWRIEFPVIVLFVCFINCLYAGVSYARWQESKRLAAAPVPAGEAPPAYLARLLVTSGHRKIQVPVAQVALICLEHGVTWVVTFDQVRYHVDEPLQTLQEQLDPASFFRVNRQTIVQLSACYSYQSAEYGKLKLRLVPPLGAELLISQKTAPAFRKWMQR